MESLPFVLAGLVALLVYAALVLADRRAIFWLGFVATLVPVEYVDRYFVDLPSAVKWLPELALTGAGCAAFVLCPRERLRLPRALLAVLAAQLALALVSAAYNGTSWQAFVVAQRGLVLFFAAALAHKAGNGIFARERRQSFLVGAGVLSALVSVLQRVTVARSEPDRVTGLFSLGEVVLFFHLVVLALVLSAWVERRPLGRWNLPLVAGTLVLSLAVGNQEAAFPYLALLIGYFLLFARARRGPLLLGTLAGGGAMLLLFSFLYDSSYRSDGGRSFSDTLFDPAYLKRYFLGERHDVLTPGGDLLRGAAIASAYREIEGDRGHLLLGRGPGATSESGIAGASGALALAYPGIGRVTLSLLLGETGLLGVALHLAFLWALWCGAGRDPAEAQERLYRGALLLMAASFLVYFRMVYEPIFAWLLAGLCVPGPAAERSPLPASGAQLGSVDIRRQPRL